MYSNTYAYGYYEVVYFNTTRRKLANVLVSFALLKSKGLTSTTVYAKCLIGGICQRLSFTVQRNDFQKHTCDANSNL